MSNIYDALQLAEQERQKVEDSPVIHVDVEKSPPLSKREAAEEMGTLFQSLNSRLPATQQKVIQFLGAGEKVGTSTIVRDFAMLSVMKLGKPLLLLDADVHNPIQEHFFDVKLQQSVYDTFCEGECVDKALYQLRNSPLVVGTILNGAKANPQVHGSFNIHDFLKSLRVRFDTILIDSASNSSFSMDLAISEQVDGVVLVVEAEKTRWRTAESLKKKIVENGGNVLGVVLNKRRYHIPEFIYKWL